MPNRIKNMLFGILAVGASSLFAVAVFEGVHYYLLTNWTMAQAINLPRISRDLLRQYYLTRDRKVLQSDSRCVDFSVELLYVLKPGKCHFSNREFDTVLTIQEARHRVSGPRSSRPSVVVVGDSVAMGWGVADDESFPAQLAIRAGQPVLNLGTSSYGTARELLFLRTIAQAQSAGTLVIQYSDNDYRENRTFVFPETGWHATHHRDQFEKLTSYQAKGYSFGVFVSLAAKRAWVRLVGSNPPNPDVATDPHVEAEIFLKVLVKFPELKGKRILLVSTLLPGQPRSPFLESVEDSKNSILPDWSLQTVPVTLTESDYFYLDDHINARGHQVVAQTLVERIRQ